MRGAAIAVVLSLLALAVPAAASAAAPKPQTARTVVVERAGGTVLVRPRGSRRAVRLTKARTVRVGSTIDATRGEVRPTSTANRSGSRRQSAVFYGGAFKVTQRRAARPLTELALVGGDFSDCTTAARRRSGVFAAGRSARRRLWGRGKGRFRTRGRNGTATVRGTTWLTEDGCQGTMALNEDGKVLAETQDLDYELDPGQSVIFYCNPDGVPGVVGLYCLAVLSQPADNVFGFGIAAETPDDTYQLCVLEPDQNAFCETFPFAPEAGGFRIAGVGCFPHKAGPHVIGWALRGVVLDFPLPFESTLASTGWQCLSEPPRPGIDTPPAAKPDAATRALRSAARAGF